MPGEVVVHATAKIDADTSDVGPQIKRSMAKALSPDEGEKVGRGWGKGFHVGAHREITSGADDTGKEWGTGFFRNLKAQFKNSRMDVEVDVDYDALRTKMESFAKRMKIDIDADVDHKTMALKLQKFAKNMHIEIEADVDLKTMGAKLHRFTSELPGIMGSAFGKGSRNNFLNLVGIMVEGVGEFAQGTVKAMQFVGKALAEVPDFVQSVTKAFKGLFDQAEGGASMFTRLGGSIGEGLGSLSKMGGPITMVAVALGTVVAIAGGAVVAFFALGEAVAVVASALSLLAAGAIAVGSAMSAGVLGVLAAAVPGAIALAAAIGTVVIAFKNMSDAQKKSLEPLKKQMGTLGKEISKVFLKDLPVWLKTASDLLKDFGGPLMKSVATNVRDAVTGIAKDFQRPEIRKALASWSEALGPIAGDLTTAIGKALTGLLSFFAPLMPMARELAGAIKNIATQFSDWAASAEGQSGIKDFFDQAWGSAKSLWEIIKNVGTAIGTVFSSGKGSGQDFLTWLGEVTGKLAAFLKSPEGQQQLNTWFAEAKKFGQELMTAIGKIGEAFGKLDTEGNRAFATNLITAIGGVIEVIGKLGPAFEATGKVLAAIGLAGALAFSALLAAIGATAAVMSGFFMVLGKIPGFGWAKDVAEDLGKVSGSALDAAKSLKELPEKMTLSIDGDDTDFQDAMMRTQELTSVPPPPVITQFTGDTNSLATSATTAMNLAKGVPPEVLTTFDGDMGPISDAATRADSAITSVHPDWLTTFLGDKNPVAGVATQATGAINAVPDDNNTVFAGVNSQLTGTAAAATGAINSVPDDNTTSFIGKDSNLSGAVKAANSAVDTVPDSHTTYINGDTSGLMGKIASAKAAVSNLLSQVSGAMSNADLGGASGLTAGWAAGGLTRGPQLRVIGEDGPEAVVPLRRPLARVDPSVRELSAFAQGHTPAGKNITIAPGAIQVTVPNTNPELAASAVLDRFAILVN